MNTRRIVSVLGFIATVIGTSSVAQEGYFGVGHDKWHRDFYDRLLQKDGSSCCNHTDCRPTQSRMNGDHYEVKVDGQWVSVPKDRIMNMVAPDGGAHVCAPQQIEEYEGAIFCVILPPEGQNIAGWRHCSGKARGRAAKLEGVADNADEAGPY